MRSSVRHAAFLLAMACGPLLPVARAIGAPCDPVSDAELRRWQPRQIITTYCADKAEVERLVRYTTPGSAVRSVVEANQAQLDACEKQMDVLERAMIRQTGRGLPACEAWRG